jgi:dipeptidyl aminopeptidase/acylaminoacyl peptidase
MGSDGADPQNLTRTGRIDEFGPDWSPDGSRIAFTSYRFDFVIEGGASARGREAFSPEALTREARAPEQPQEDAEISVIDSDGGNRRDLTSGPALDVLPAFSPDGRRIAFSKVTFSRPDSENSDIFVMRADGSRTRQLTDTPRAVEWGADWQPVLTPVEATGVLEVREIGFYEYGTHSITDEASGESYALQSSSVDLDAFDGRHVTVHGTVVPGTEYGQSEGGPTLLNVTRVEELATPD